MFVSFWNGFLAPALATVSIGLVSLGLFAFAYRMIEKMLPFSVQKELEEDQNVAVAIVIAAFIVGLAIVIAAVAQG